MVLTTTAAHPHPAPLALDAAVRGRASQLAIIDASYAGRRHRAGHGFRGRHGLRVRPGAARRAAAVRALVARYPAEPFAHPRWWAKHAVVREHMCALAVWHDQLDFGHHQDKTPRMELAFAGSLRDFAIYPRERARTSAHRHR